MAIFDEAVQVSEVNINVGAEELHVQITDESFSADFEEVKIEADIGEIVVGGATESYVDQKVAQLVGEATEETDTFEEVEDKLDELSTRDFVLDFLTGLQ